MATQTALSQEEFFARNPVVRTHDLDEARHITSTKLCDHKLIADHRRFGADTGKSV